MAVKKKRQAREIRIAKLLYGVAVKWSAQAMLAVSNHWKEASTNEHKNKFQIREVEFNLLKNGFLRQPHLEQCLKFML